MTDFQQRIPLGRTGLEVSRLGIGSSFTGDSRFIEEAVDQGINYLYWGSIRRPAFGRAMRSVARRNRDAVVHPLAMDDDMLIAGGAEQIEGKVVIDDLRLLKTQDVGRGLGQKLLDDGGAEPHRIDVPRGDFHEAGCSGGQGGRQDYPALGFLPCKGWNEGGAATQKRKGPRSGGMERGPT